MHNGCLNDSINRHFTGLLGYDPASTLCMQDNLYHPLIPFAVFIPPRYEVYRGYIVFAFSVIMFVGLSVGLSVCL